MSGFQIPTGWVFVYAKLWRTLILVPDDIKDKVREEFNRRPDPAPRTDGAVDGWVMVPREQIEALRPIRDFLAENHTTDYSGGAGRTESGKIVDAIDSILAASPPPPDDVRKVAGQVMRALLQIRDWDRMQDAPALPDAMASIVRVALASAKSAGIEPTKPEG
jgi:hypothetical protein